MFGDIAQAGEILPSTEFLYRKYWGLKYLFVKKSLLIHCTFLVTVCYTAKFVASGLMHVIFLLILVAFPGQ